LFSWGLVIARPDFDGKRNQRRTKHAPCSPGLITKGEGGKFIAAHAVTAIVAHYRQKQRDSKGIKLELVAKQHRKLKRENDLRAELLVERAKVVEEFRKVVEPIKALFQ
jgi:ribosomal protein L32